MLRFVFPIVSLFVYCGMAIFVFLMIMRLIFTFTDPNPFGKIGRLAYKLKKLTDRFVRPFADFLYIYNINRKYAPILAGLIGSLLLYFGLQIFFNASYITDGLYFSSARGDYKAILGYLLYGALSIYILLIFIRILSSWFIYTKKTIFAFAKRATDPLMKPLQKLIPPIGMFDVSAMILLIVLNLLQGFVLRTFVGP
jgi:YggT family protein